MLSSVRSMILIMSRLSWRTPSTTTPTAWSTATATAMTTRKLTTTPTTTPATTVMTTRKLTMSTPPVMLVTTTVTTAVLDTTMPSLPPHFEIPDGLLRRPMRIDCFSQDDIDAVLDILNRYGVDGVPRASSIIPVNVWTPDMLESLLKS